jgi:hypothetical protein
MSLDEVRALSARINQTIRDARQFHAQLNVFFAAPGCSTLLTNSENEISFGKTARQLASDLETLESAALPIQAELGMNALRPLFARLIERWEWHQVIGPDGDAFLAAQQNLWNERRRTYLSAVRSYVKASAIGRITERPSEGYLYTAKDAEREKIPAFEPLVETEDELKRIQKSWIFSAYLGPEFPTRTPDDFRILAQAVQDIEDGIRGTELEASGNEPNRSAPASVDVFNSPEWISWAAELHRNEYLMSEARRVDPMPDPNELTVGQMIDFLTFNSRTPQNLLAIPEVNQMYVRREMILSQSAGFKAFGQWRDIEVHRLSVIDAANELLARLVERLRKPSKEIRAMRLLDAVHQIDDAEALSAPYGASQSAESRHPFAGLAAPVRDDTRLANPPVSQSKPPGARKGLERRTDLVSETPETNSPRASRKEPSKKAIAAYRAVKIIGKKQEDVAPQLGVTQGTVSRWVDQVSEWIKAGNVLPDLEVPKRKAIAMDPRTLEQGPRPHRAHKSENMRDTSD